jgi:ATP-dependent Zn protease
MRRVELDATATGPRSLVMDLDGKLLLHGDDAPERRYTQFAMTAPDANRSSSMSMASLVDREVQRILYKGYEMAREILHEHNDQLTKLADALLEKEQLDRKQFEALLG